MLIKCSSCDVRLSVYISVPSRVIVDYAPTVKVLVFCYKIEYIGIFFCRFHISKYILIYMVKNLLINLKFLGLMVPGSRLGQDQQQHPAVHTGDLAGRRSVAVAVCLGDM